MSYWRVLELTSQIAGDTSIPQLLVKPVFGLDSYTIHVTDLSSIWTETLDLDSIVDRASFEQSPIEISKQDTTQLAILLVNIHKSLVTAEYATCRITRIDSDGLMLHTSIDLPAPLDSLTWKFRLEKQTAGLLKNELILPLLISSHIQHERISNLVETITSKDRAITRLIDQYESSNLDLAAAFPSIGSLKPGRKLIKREQASKHVPALQVFEFDAWKRETEQLADSKMTTLGLFQEALQECKPEVPPELKDDRRFEPWWINAPTRLSSVKPALKLLNEELAVSIKSPKCVPRSDDDATDDEFETHEHFKTRNRSGIDEKLSMGGAESSSPSSLLKSDETTDEDDDDLDAPIRSQSGTRLASTSPIHTKSPTPPPSSPTREDTPPIPRPKEKGFRIGGSCRRKVTASPPPVTFTDADTTARLSTTDDKLSVESYEMRQNSPRKPRRPFKIGGRNKVEDVRDSQEGQRSGNVDEVNDRRSSAPVPTSPPASSIPIKGASKLLQEAEETAEEKAERRRAELKRRNDEAARKQAQTKKKKRF